MFLGILNKCIKNFKKRSTNLDNRTLMTCKFDRIFRFDRPMKGRRIKLLKPMTAMT